MSNRAITVCNLALSALIYAGLMWLIYAFELKERWSDGLPWLPHFNAACNAASATAVALGVWFIRSGKKRAHAAAMIFATTASGAFLVGYLTHHTLHGDTPFTGTGAIRVVYFAILISHIILSAVALPLILNTLSFAALRRFDAHRRIARWTYPVWLYVSVTGVTIWFFLRVWFPASPDRGQVRGYVESHGYVSMEAEHCTRRNERRGATLQVVEGLGRSGDSVTVLPPTVDSVTAIDAIKTSSPSLEFDFHLFSIQ